MLFLVNLANEGVPDGAYLLSKLYSRSLVRQNPQNDEATETVLISCNPVKAAVWTIVACNLAKKTRKSAKDQAYFTGKLNKRLQKLQSENVP